MPKTTLRFHRTHGTHGSCLIKAYGLLQWRIQIKISQERWHNRTESKRGHIASFQLPPATPLQSDIDIWQCTSSIANREPHASLGVVQVFWVPVTQTRGTYVTDLLLSSVSKCQTGIESLSLPVSQYSININFSAQHKAPGKQRHSYWAKYVKCLEVISQELGKSVPDISLEWRGCTIQACMSSFTQAKWKYSKLMPFLFYCILTLSEFSRLKSSDNGNRVQRCATAPVFPRPHWVTLKHAPRVNRSWQTTNSWACITELQKRKQHVKTLLLVNCLHWLSLLWGPPIPSFSCTQVSHGQGAITRRDALTSPRGDTADIWVTIVKESQVPGNLESTLFLSRLQMIKTTNS